MPFWISAAALVLVASLVALQIAIPRIAAAQIRNRLTERGGSASVTVQALPASRLLREQGDRLVVRGQGLAIGLAGNPESPEPAGLSTLDGFAEVDIELVDFRTGPFAVAAFVLRRSGGGSYAMAAQATTTAAELMRPGRERISSLPAGSLLASIAAAAPGAGRELTVAVQVELLSEDGTLRVVAGGGSLAGYPAGPIATLIAAAVARRLEIAP